MSTVHHSHRVRSVRLLPLNGYIKLFQLQLFPGEGLEPAPIKSKYNVLPIAPLSDMCVTLTHGSFTTRRDDTHISDIKLIGTIIVVVK